MKHVQLGRSGLKVSRISVGCWSFGGDAASYWGEQDQKDVDALVGAALDMGVNFFDTAMVYNDGASEVSLGKALKGRRDRAVICDKIPCQKAEELDGYEKKVTDSLKRLDTDAIDILMIHWPSLDRDLTAKNLLKLEEMRQKGYIRSVGVSNFGVGALELAKSLGVRVDADEIAYNLLSRAIEREILPYLAEHQISAAAYSPLMQGILTGKFASIAEIPANRRRTVHFSSATNELAKHGGPGAEAEVLRALEVLSDCAKEINLSAGQLALAWALSKKGMATAMVGCRNIAQLKENAFAAEAQIPAEILAKLDEASLPVLRKVGGDPDMWCHQGQSRIW